MSPHNTNLDLTPAQLMEAEEIALVKQERCDDFLEHQAVAAQKSQAEPLSVAGQTDVIKPQVQVNTDELSECHDPTLADEMEAEERELVIKNSVNDARTYAKAPLTDAEIREQALTRLDQIDPNPRDGNHC